MTKIADIADTLDVYDGDVGVPGFNPNSPSTPDVIVPLSVIRGVDDAETLTNKTIGAGSALAFNTGVTLSGILKGQATPTVASIAAGAVSDQDITVTGAVVGDIALVQLSSAFVAGMTVQAWHVATDKVTVRLFNPTSGSIAPGALTLNAVVLHFS